MRSLALGLCFSFTLAFAACSAGNDPSTGGSGGQSSGPSMSGTSSGTPCNAGTEQCVDGIHQSCVGGVFTNDPCPPGQGCSPTNSKCIPCTCTPGMADGTCADASSQTVCSDTCVGKVAKPCDSGMVCLNGACVTAVCTPGSAHCVSGSMTEICNASGTGYDPGTTCGVKELCTEGAGCVPLCQAYAATPSSVGCSFFALNMSNFDESNVDGVTIGNTSSTLTASVNFYTSYGGNEALMTGNIQVPPLGEYTISLPNGSNDYLHGISALRAGGAFRVESDIPIIAYQHSPLVPAATNDVSCLLPEAALGTHYFVTSYYDALGAVGEPHPSYFDVIATTDNTTVQVKVPQATAGGTGVQAMAAGGTQTFMLNRYDTLQVINANAGTAQMRDISGTEITASSPIAVFGAVQCAQVPAGYTYCDHVEEQMTPLRNWGKTYIGAHIPKRSNSERYYWRVTASKDNTSISTTPTQPGFPVMLNKGQFYEFYMQADATAAGGSVVFTGTQPFEAYQYITGQDAFGAGTGDPAMITAVPVEQFLNRYVILTPNGYTNNYVQILRTTADDVTVDGVVVPASAYYTIGAYTVADYAVGAGPHSILSNSPFGIVATGYTAVTSYGYPGGLALNNIAPP